MKRILWSLIGIIGGTLAGLGTIQLLDGHFPASIALGLLVIGLVILGIGFYYQAKCKKNSRADGRTMLD